MAQGFVKFGSAPTSDAEPRDPPGFVRFEGGQAPIARAPLPTAQTQPTTAQPEAEFQGALGGVVRGTGNVISSTGRVGEFLGLPTEGVQQFGRDLAARAPAEVDTLAEIPQKPLTFAKETVGEVAPQVGLTLGGAAAGAALGAPLGPVGVAGGAVVGAFAPGFIQEFGSNLQRQDEKGINKPGQAAGAAAVSAAIDLLGPEAAIPRRIGERMVTKAAGEAGEGIVKRTAKGAAVEAGTETVQEGISRLGTDDPLLADAEGYGMAGAKGAVGGGAISATLGPGPARPAAANPEEGIPGVGAEPADILTSSPTGPRMPGDAQLDLFPDAPSTTPYMGEISAAARKHGVNPSVLATIADIESGFRADAKNPNSTAGGLFQFTDGTWGQYGQGGDKFDPAASADAAARMTADSQRYLTKRLGRKVEPWELYLAHQQGPGGAAQLLNPRNQDRPAVELVGRDAVVNNGGREDMTVSEFAGLWRQKFEAKAGQGRAAEMMAADLPDSAYDPAADRETLSTSLDQSSLVKMIRGEGKASAEVVKAATAIAEGSKGGDMTAAQALLDKQQASLDTALEKLDEQQRSLDEARVEHKPAEHAKYQREIDSKLDALAARQEALARATGIVREWRQINAPQGELDFNAPEAQAPQASGVAPQPTPTPVPTPAAARAMPGLFPEPVAGPTLPASQTLLAQQETAAAREDAQQAANTTAETSIRNGLLQAVLGDTTTRNPTARFVAQLKRAGRDPALTAQEAEAIAAFEEQRDASAAAEAERVAGEDTTLGVPERVEPTAPRQPTYIAPPRQKAGYTPPFTLTQQTEDDLRRQDKAAAKREAKAAREPELPPGPANGDLFEVRKNVKTRAAKASAKMGKTRSKAFMEGAQAALGEKVEKPKGKPTLEKAFQQGEEFVREEMAQQQAERAPVAETPADREAFDTRLEYMLESKEILPKDYQQIRVLAEQGNVPITDLDKMLDEAGERRAALRKGAFKASTFGKRGQPETAAKFDAKLVRVRKEFREILDRMGLHDVPVEAVSKSYLELVYGLDANGVYVWESDQDGLRHLIEVAIDANDRATTIRHEAIHAMRMMNLFTPREWATLSEWARKSPIMAEALQSYRGKPTDAAVIEEVIAEGYGRWAADRAETGPVGKIFQKIQKLLRALRQLFAKHGITTAEDIFERIEGGQIGARPRGPDRGPDRGREARAERGQSFRLMERLPTELQGPATAARANIDELAQKAFIGLSFTEHVAEMASKVLPSAKRFIELNSQSHALSRRFEERLSEIKRAYHALPDAVKGTGKGSINDYLYTSRMKQAWGFQPSYLKPVKVDPEMKAAFDRLPKPAQDVVKQVYRFNYDARRELLSATIGAVNAEFDPQIAEATDPKEKAKLEADKSRALKHFSRLHGAPEDMPYSPLKRSGEWVVVGMSPEYAAAKEAGKAAAMAEMRSSADHYWVNFYDTRGEAEAAAARVKTKYGTVQHFQRTQVTDQEVGGKELYVAFNELRKKVETQLKADPKNDVTRKLYQLATDLYLHSLADTSARKAELKADLVDARDPVTGEAIDMMKAFVTRGQATTHFVAAVHNSAEMHTAIDAMQKEASSTEGDRLTRERFRNALLWRYVNNLNRKPSRAIDAIARGVSIWNLLLSPAYYFTNATQPTALSLPAIAAEVGYGRAWNHMLRAYKELAPMVRSARADDRMRIQVPDDVKEVIQFLLDRGRLDAGLAQELGDWEIGEGNGLSKPFVKAWNKADQILRYLPQNIETLNRVVTGIAAYRAAKERGKNEAAAREFASKVIYETHGDYSGFNEPGVIARAGNPGKIVFQFRKFQLIMASHLAKMAHNSLKGATREEKLLARKALGFTLAHVGVLGGAVGMPGATAIGWLVQSIMGALDGEDDYENWELDLEKWLKANAPGPFADLLFKGAPYALGKVDLSGRLGLGEVFTLFPFTDPAAAVSSRDDLFEMLGKVLAGAAGTIPAKAVDAGEFLRAGDPYRAVEAFAPNGVIQGALKANRLASRGMENKAGDRLIKAEDLDPADIGWSVLGFQSSRLADQAAHRSAAFEKDAHYKAITTSMKRRYARASREGDAQKMAELRGEWAELQDTRERDGMARQPLSTLLRSVSDQERREKRVVGGVAYTRANQRSVEEMAD